MTHKHQPASVTQANEKREAAWNEFDALNDELGIYADKYMDPPAGFYARLETARKAWLEAEAEYTKIYRAAEALEARRRERAAEAEINTTEAEPEADFSDVPDSNDTTEGDYEAMDRLAQTYPSRN